MRLFIAINFTDEVRNALSETIANLRSAAKRGRYTAWDNLHLTLVFIGESDRINDITHVMQDSAREAFPTPLQLDINGAGTFNGRNGKLHWMGVRKTAELTQLVESLTKGLRQAGFDIEKRRYSPHITIGRDVVLSENAQILVHPTSMQADHISLMRSDTHDGQPVYTEIASVYCTDKTHSVDKPSLL